MTFSRQRAPGAWISGVPMATGEAEAFDGNLAKAIDGDGGGTYAPSTQIIIGGSGFKVTGAFDVSGAAAFTGTVECKAGLSVTTAGTFSCSRAGTFSNGLTVSTAGSFTCSRPATFSNTLALNSDTVVDTAATFTCNGAAGFNAAVLITGDVSTSGQIETSGLISLTGAAKIGWRFATLADADATIAVSSYDEVRLPAVVASTRTITLLNTGAIAGSKIRVTRDYRTANINSTTGSTQLVANGGAIGLYLGAAPGQFHFAELTFDGTNWFVSQCYREP